MTYSIVVAFSSNHVIGRNNALPWRLSNDLQHFKLLTLGKTIVMGRKTYDSIGKLLPGRDTVIMTKNPNFRVRGASVISHVDEIALLPTRSDEIMIVGGSSIYDLFLEICDTLYVTEVKATLEGDAFFPDIDPAVWLQSHRESHAADQKNEYDYDFVTYQLRGYGIDGALSGKK